MDLARIFQLLDQAIQAPLLAMVSALVEAMVSYIDGPLRAGMVVYVGWSAFSAWKGLSTEAFGEIISRLIKVGVVAWLALNADTFLTWIGTPLLETLPQGITRAVAAATGGSADPDVNAFDALLRNGIAAGMKLQSRLSTWAFPGHAAVVILWGSSVAATTISYVYFIGCRFVLTAIVALGPLWVGCWLFGFLRGMANGALRVALTAIVQQAMLVAAVQIINGAETIIVGNIIRNPAADLGAIIAQAIAGIVVMCVGVLMFRRVPRMAEGLAGGVGFHSSEIWKHMAERPAAAAKKGAMTGGAMALNATRAAGGAAVRRVRGPRPAALSAPSPVSSGSSSREVVAAE